MSLPANEREILNQLELLDGILKPTAKELGQMTGRPKENVSSALFRLYKKGYVDREGNGGNEEAYRWYSIQQDVLPTTPPGDMGEMLKLLREIRDALQFQNETRAQAHIGPDGSVVVHD